MKSFFALYVKELKANKTLFLFLLLLIVGMNIYGLMKVANVSQEQLGTIIKFRLLVMSPINLAKSILVLSLPFLLAHTFNSEWRSETHYQMFTLPISRYKVILAKVAAVASVGFLGGGIVIGSLYLLMLDILPGQVLSFEGMEVTLFLVLVLCGGVGLATYMVFIFGLVTGMEGAKFSVKRYRGLAAVIFFLIAVFLYIGFFHQMTMALDFLGHISVGPTIGPIELSSFAYTILVGIIFMIIGLVMYEKRAEI